jgi:ribonuclease HI
MKEVDIFTDGACSGNPGPGGYGVILKFNGQEKMLSKGFKNTTNNRMELLAVIAGLSALNEKCKVRLFSDSKYIIDAINKGWAVRWKNNGWKRNKKKYALNSDLWEKLLKLLLHHEVEFVWVKGHSGHDENERCDSLAVAASSQPNLCVDVKNNNN